MLSSSRTNFIPSLLVIILLISSITTIGCNDRAKTEVVPAKALKMTDQKANMSNPKAVSLLGTERGPGAESYALPPRSELLNNIPPEERELVENAKKSIYFCKYLDGSYTLIEVDGKQIHEDPAVKYLEDAGIKGKTRAVETME